MGRPRRFEQIGAHYHVGSRGNNKQPIYLDDLDRSIFLELFERVTRRYGWIVYAYCLMTNHFHIVMQNAEGGLSDGMQVLNGEFSRRTNRRHGRIDHLLKNRFSDRLIETEDHLYEACRYVDLNPVRAGLCELPEEWEWSSFRAHQGVELPRSFHAAEETLRRFGGDPEQARAAYCAFVGSGPVPVSDSKEEPGPGLADWDVSEMY
jgi:putative transposase